MQEDYEECISLTLRTRNSKNPFRMLETNWKRRWLPLCLARQARKVSMGRPVARLMISSLSLHVSWKPVNPQDFVWKNLYRIIMRTMLQQRETVHCNITIWYTNLFQCLKPWRFPHQKQQWIKNGRNLKRFRRGTWQKSEVTQRWSMKQGRRAQKFRWTSVIWRMPNSRQSTKNFRSSCTPRRHCERWFWILCSIHWTRVISISNYGSKSHGYHIQTARVLRTSSWRSICLYPGENGRCSKIIENSQIGMSRHLDSSTTTQTAKIMVQYGRASRSSWAKSVRSSFGRTVIGKTIRESSIRIRLGEGFQLGMLIHTSWKRVTLICVFLMTPNWLERNKILIRCGKYSTKKLIWENQHLSLIMYTCGVLRDNVK